VKLLSDIAGNYYLASCLPSGMLPPRQSQRIIKITDDNYDIYSPIRII